MTSGYSGIWPRVYTPANWNLRRRFSGSIGRPPRHRRDRRGATEARRARWGGRAGRTGSGGRGRGGYQAHGDRRDCPQYQRLAHRPAAVRSRRGAPRSRPGTPESPARAPARVDRPLPREDGRRHHQRVHGLQGPAQHRPRAGQGRHSLSPGRDPRRGQGPGHVDDLEVRRCRHPIRRRQGRRHRRSQEAQHARDRGPDPPLHDRDKHPDRPRARTFRPPT